MALILVAGIPAAGKSTFCRKMKEKHPELVELIEFDRFLEEQGEITARTTRKMFEKHVENQILKNRGKLHFLEDVLYLQSMRRPFLRMSRKYGIQIGVVFMKCGIEMALKRNREREEEQRQNCESIRKMFKEFESIDEFENFIELDDEADISDTFYLLDKLNIDLSKEGMSVKQRSENLKISSTNSIPHQYDILSRKVIGELLKTGKIPKRHGKMLNEIRREYIRNHQPVEDSEVLENEILEIYYKSIT